MVREAIGVAAAVWLLAGCASNMPASNSINRIFSHAQQCLRDGGWWRQSLGVCDMQKTEVEMMGTNSGHG